MNERDYLKLKRQFEDEYRQKLAALELIWQEWSGGKKPPKEPSETNGSTAERGNSAASVEEFVKQWVGDPFSAKQVEAWITQVKGLSANRTTIIHKLRRMVNDGELCLVSKGSGKRASLYTLTPTGEDHTQADTGDPDEEGESEAAGEPEYQPAMATVDDIEQLRGVLRVAEVNVAEFRAGVLQAEFGVQKASQLTKDQIQELIFRYRPGPPPNDDIPF